jgi:hypothetical protein
VPARDMLSNHFVRNYHHYADQMFVCRMGESAFTRLRPTEFMFDLYASGEYTNMLEREWAGQPPA